MGHDLAREQRDQAHQYIGLHVNYIAEQRNLTAQQEGKQYPPLISR
jgi:hypothetical protein